MTQEEFQKFVARDAHVADPLGRAAQKMQPAQFGPLTEAAAVVLLFPLVQYIPRSQVVLPSFPSCTWERTCPASWAWRRVSSCALGTVLSNPMASTS